MMLRVCSARWLPSFHRALRTQQFLAFTATDLANREAKQKALLQEFEASRRGKLVSQAELDEFYQRLQVWANISLSSLGRTCSNLVCAAQTPCG